MRQRSEHLHQTAAAEGAQLRQCVLALGGSDPDTLEWLRTALGGPARASTPPPPASDADPFAPLPRELWLPAGPGHRLQGFATTWVYLPAGGSLPTAGALAHTVFDLALLAVPDGAAGLAACRRLVRTVSCLGVNRCVVVRIRRETGSRAPGSPGEQGRDAPSEGEQAEITGLRLDPANPESADALRLALARALTALPPEPPRVRPRFWIEHTGEARGPESTFRGLLTDGDLHTGQTLRLLPAGRLGRVNSLSTPDGEVAHARPGQRLALTLEWLENTGDVPASNTATPKAGAHVWNAGSDAAATVPPSPVLVAPEWGELSDTLDVLLADPVAAPGEEPLRPWQDRERIRVCLGHAITPGTLFLHADRGDISAGRLAQLRLDHPLPALGGDRLLVRAEGDSAREAAARVLDPEGDRKQWQRPAQRALLAARAGAVEDLPVWLTSQLKRDRLVRRRAVLARTRFPPATIAEALSAAAQAGQIIVAGEWVTDAAWWEHWRRQAGEAVDRFHAAQPHRLGLPLDQLRKQWMAERLPPEGFEAVLPLLTRAGLVVRGTVVHRSGRRPVLSARLAGAVAELRRQLLEQPLAPPARSVLARDPASVEALQFLLESGEAVEVGANLVLEAGAYARAVAVIRDHLRRHGHATLSELRERLGTTRRVLIPLCEKLEREGVTCREGDYHRLAEARKRPPQWPRRPPSRLPPGRRRLSGSGPAQLPGS